MELISVFTEDAQTSHIRIQWNMGNSCNYNCEYCPPILHNGSRPWIDSNKCVTAVTKIVDSYNSKGIKVHWDLIGGEVTVMPGFADIVKAIHESGSSCSIFTNASRTVDWWNKNKKYINDVTMSFHPHTTTQEHFVNVINEIKDTCSISVQLAAAKDYLEDLLTFRNKLANDVIPQWQESIHIKRLYKKMLGSSSSQDSFYDYSERDEEILNMSFVKIVPQPDKPEPIIEEVKELTTQFTYQDQSVEIVKTKDIKNLKLNSFKGMYCDLGTTMLSIDFEGNVWGSWCGTAKLGNISDVDNIEFGIKPVICDIEYCNNENDLRINKYR